MREGRVVMSSIRRHLRLIVQVAVGLLVLVGIIAWLAGLFHTKTGPGTTPVVVEPTTAPTVLVEVRETPRIRRTVGTIRAVHETTVASRIQARVQRVTATAGQRVEMGQVLVELDRADIEAMAKRAEANRDAARARLRQATSDLEKVTRLRREGAATEREFQDAARNQEVAVSVATAADESLKEAEAQLAYATVKSPITGIVVDRQVEEGDMARPGAPLIRLYVPDKLQLIASVPERLAMNLAVGQEVGVEIDALDLACRAHISEIVPEASPLSRAFVVKVTGACPPNVYSGMFGRLLIEEGRQQRLLVPEAAVRQVGQLEMVQVVDADGAATTRFVRTGERIGDQVEVQSGLEPGERVLAAFGA